MRSISKKEVILYHIRQSIAEILRDDADELHAFFHMSVATEMLYERRRRIGAILPPAWEAAFSSPEWLERFEQRNNLYNWMKHDRKDEESHVIDFNVRFIVETCILPTLLRFESMFDDLDPSFDSYLRMLLTKHGVAAGVRAAVQKPTTVAAG